MEQAVVYIILEVRRGISEGDTYLGATSVGIFEVLGMNIIVRNSLGEKIKGVCKHNNL